MSDAARERGINLARWEELVGLGDTPAEPDGRYRLRIGGELLPLLFSLAATRPA